MTETTIEDLALRDQVVEGGEGLFQRGLVVVAMELVEIDVVQAHSFEAGVALLDDVLAGEALVVGHRAIAHREEDFGCDDVGVARKLAQAASHDLFALAARIGVGGIEEIDSQFVGPIDTLGRSLILGRIAVGQPTAKADFRDLHTRVAESSILHVSSCLLI